MVGVASPKARWLPHSCGFVSTLIEDFTMSFNAEQIAYAGKAAIDYFVKNSPVDQVNVDRPLIKKLMGSKSEYAGGLQYVVEQLLDKIGRASCRERV